MNYNLNLEEFETVADQLLTQTELEDLSLLLGHDVDGFVISLSDREKTAITLENDKIFIKVRDGVFKSLL